MQIALGKNPKGERLALVIGGATKDADVRTTQNGKTVVKFGLGIGKRADDSSIYADCEAWGRVGELAKTVKKGDIVLAAGYLHSHEYNGQTYTSLNCEIVLNASLMGTAAISQAAAQVTGQPAESTAQTTAPQENGFTEITGEDDLPF